MGATILVVEDEPRMRSLIADYIVKNGMAVVEAENGQEAISRFQLGGIHLIVLDIMLPGLDGWTVCRRVRKDSSIPIIILTARSEEDDELMGYELGADDYMTKPFSPKVLIAKVKALLRRVDGQHHSQSSPIEASGISVDPLSHKVCIGREPASLSPKEYDLLLYLIKNKGIVLSREKILNSVWGYEYFGDTRTVDTHVKRLREKLGDKSDAITTVRGSGYRFEVEA